MSTRPRTCYILKCDSCGGDYTAGDYVPHAENPADLRKAAAREGWNTDGNRDWCGPCDVAE